MPLFAECHDLQWSAEYAQASAYRRSATSCQNVLYPKCDTWLIKSANDNDPLSGDNDILSLCSHYRLCRHVGAAGNYRHRFMRTSCELTAI